MNRVAVFGSLNMDIIAEVDKLPGAGESVHAKSMAYRVGGKGATQAAAAAAAEASTILIGTVGQDSFGQQIIAVLDKISNLDGSRIINDPDQPTGVALIYSAHGDNTIAYHAGANSQTTDKSAEDNANIFKEADVLLIQFETPEAGIREALRAAHFGKTITIVSPAPYYKFDKELLEAIDIIIPNEPTFGLMAQDFGLEGKTLEQKMISWSKLYPKTRLIVTRGIDGLSYVEGDNVVKLEPIKVEAIDSTGAGDIFCGVLGALLSQDLSFEVAVFKAAVAAGLSTAHKGALGSAPKMEDVDLYIKQSQLS